MLVKIGQRPKDEDLVSLLLACHERIRSFVAIARAVGCRDGLSEAEVVEACVSCERYFSEALPLHVQDEEESLYPRLLGKTTAIDEALTMMERQHRDHAPLLTSLLRASRAVRESPFDPRRRAELGSAAAALADEFGAHLLLEETEIFPAVRRLLSSASQGEVVDELRARRRSTGRSAL